MHKVFYILLILLSHTILFAQSDTLISFYDNSRIEVRDIQDNDLKQYKNNKDFDYRKEVTVPENYFAKLLSKIFSFFWGNGNILGKIIKYIIVALFFVFIILKVLGFKVNKLFYKNKSIENIVPIEENIDDINNIDIDEIIKKAIESKDYRKAIRYLFIKTLKHLSFKEIINWQINKTNRDYYYEISDKDIKEQFIKLSQIFTYVWYGDFNINEKNFIEFEKKFANFLANLSRP